MGRMSQEKIPEVQIFRGLTKDELKIIAAHCQKVDFTKDQTLIEEGGEVSALFILLKGQLKVFLPQKTEGVGKLRSADVDLNILKEGDCFGEYSLIDKAPASASIVAMEPGQVIKISHDDLKGIFQVHDRMGRIIYYNMLQILTKRLKEKDTEIDLSLIGR